MQKLHSKFVSRADNLTPDEKKMSDLFYKSDKEAIWNEAHAKKAEAGKAEETTTLFSEDKKLNWRVANREDGKIYIGKPGD